ncbi:TIGR01841 family phasin [Sphingomonas sp. PL-96]|nr:TIGR01841 family phasin [Sphingomonas sp. PL-96]
MAGKEPRTKAPAPAARKAPALRAKPVVSPPPVATAAEEKSVQVPFAAAAVPVPAEQIVAPVNAQLEAASDTPANAALVAAEAAKTLVEEISPVAEPTAPAPEEHSMIHTNDAPEATTAKAQAMFADMNARTKAAMEKSTKAVEEMTDLAKGNVEALVEASRIAAKGLESLGHEAADFGRRNFESATATMKTLASVKSPTEFFKLQSDYVRSTFDALVAETSKNTEAMLKLAGDAAQPLSNRVAIATDKFKVVGA